MPSGPRILTNNVFGTVSDNPLTSGATTLNSNGLADLAAVSSAFAVLVIDPERTAGAPEIVFVTAHTGSATSATIGRGKYGTSARQHAQGTPWVHAATKEDLIQILTSSTRPSDPFEGQLIYETDTDRYAVYDGSGWRQPHNPPACRVYHSTTQSINDNSETTLVFNSERYDTDSMHSTSVDTSRITFNTAGLYEVGATVAVAAAGDYSSVFGRLRVNGTNFIDTHVLAPNTATTTPFVKLGTVYKFAAGDYVEVRFYQDNTANAARNVQASGTATLQDNCEFWATWIGVG